MTYVPHGSLVHLTPYQTEMIDRFRYLFLSRSHLFPLFNELIVRFEISVR
jgi:hypothetical protein